MAPYARVFNLTTQRYVKPGQARGWVNDGVCVWDVEGATIRNLTFAEMVERRSRLSQERDPIPYGELRGILVVGLVGLEQERKLARIATHFAFPCKAKRVCR